MTGFEQARARVAAVLGVSGASAGLLGQGLDMLWRSGGADAWLSLSADGLLLLCGLLAGTAAAVLVISPRPRHASGTPRHHTVRTPGGPDHFPGPGRPLDDLL